MSPNSHGCGIFSDLRNPADFGPHQHSSAFALVRFLYRELRSRYGGRRTDAPEAPVSKRGRSRQRPLSFLRDQSPRPSFLRWPFTDSRKAAGESRDRGHVSRRSIDLASWLESLGRLGWSIIARLSWTGNEPKSGHPSRVPILDGLATHGAFEATDLALLYQMLTAIINRATLTGSITKILT
jgi:hypothetical protein